MNSDQNAVTSEAATLVGLRKLAKEMKIDFHPNIGVKKLEERIKAKRIELDNDVAEPIAAAPVANAPVPLTVIQQANLIEQTERQKIQKIRKDASSLVRIVLTCKNPAKQEWPGEIFSAGSTLMGSHKKFVPFGNDEGWHVPQVILQMIKERECQIHVNSTDEKGRKVKKGKLIKEFSVQVLDPLTPKEIEELKIKQAMAHSID